MKKIFIRFLRHVCFLKVHSPSNLRLLFAADFKEGDPVCLEYLQYLSSEVEKIESNNPYLLDLDDGTQVTANIKVK